MLTEQYLVSDEPHSVFLSGRQRKYEFPNGYQASVVSGHPALCGNATYELAVMRDGKLDYSTPITDDVERGHAERINKLLKQIAALPPKGAV